MPYYRRAAKRPRYGKRDKYSIQQKGAVAAVAANQTSAVDIVPATTTEGMRKVKHLTVNLTQIAASNAESNLFWALVYVPQGTTAGSTQHRNGRSNSRQHVRTQPVCHELRRGRPFSRSHQDVLSYLSQPQRRRQDHSPHPSYSRWGGYYSLSCCSLCNHPQLNLQ